MSLPETPPLCPHCHAPMQMLVEKRDKEDKIIMQQFGCHCRGLHYENFHAGDRHKERKNARS